MWLLFLLLFFCCCCCCCWCSCCSCWCSCTRVYHVWSLERGFFPVKSSLFHFSLQYKTFISILYSTDKESSQFRSPFDHRRSKSSCGIAQVESTPKDDNNSPRRLSDTALPEKHHQHLGKKNLICCYIKTIFEILLFDLLLSNYREILLSMFMNKNYC